MQHARDRGRLVTFFAGLAVKERLFPDLHVRPLVAELFLTDNCNLRCVSCACWRTTTRGELSTDEWRGVIDQCADLGIIKVNFTGGEPLLRRDAPDLMAHAGRRGISSIHLNTNAILLDQRRLDAVLEAGCRSFNVSVDGSDAATHDLVRGVAGAYERTRTHLEALIARRAELGLRIRMNFTVMRTNVRDLPAMVELAQELDVRLYLNLATDHTFLFRHPQVTGESQVPLADVDEALSRVQALRRRAPRCVPRESELAYLRRHFAELLQTDLPCAESQLKLMIHSKGETGGCWGHDPVRNVRDTPLREIVDGRHYRDEHARLFRKDCVGCGSNYALNLRWRPSSYVDDLLYRTGRRQLVPARAVPT